MFLKDRKGWLVLLLVFFTLNGCALSNDAPSQSFSKVHVTLGEKPLTLELAATELQRNQGLSKRHGLCGDCGMLFLYTTPRKVRFWMKDTYIPLDLAFISEQGVVQQIEFLEPLNLEPVKSQQPVKYVVEMNRGWFEKNSVAVGSRFSMTWE